ncbi:hypothetical protein [Halosimplex sp. J119]
MSGDPEPADQKGTDSSGGSGDRGGNDSDGNSGNGSGQNGGSGNGNGQNGGSENGPGQNGGSGDQQGPSWAEKGVMVVSVAFTVLLFAYAGWQMVGTPTGETPQVSVEGTDPLENGSVAVTVRLRNPSDVGLVSATVEANCSSPPPEIGFSYVPAASTRTGTLVCPRRTTDPSVSVSSWVSR